MVLPTDAGDACLVTSSAYLTDHSSYEASHGCSADKDLRQTTYGSMNKWLSSRDTDAIKAKHILPHGVW